MSGLEDKLGRNYTQTFYFCIMGEKVPLRFRGAAPTYYLVVENHEVGYHAHVLKRKGCEYKRTNQMVTKDAADNYYIEPHGRPSEHRLEVNIEDELPNILKDITHSMVNKLGRYPEKHLRRTMSSYARKIYPED